MFWRLSDAAEADLVEITHFISRQDPRAAARLLDKCLDRFAMLVRQPLLGEACEELLEGLRQFTVDRYVIFYRVARETGVVDVVRVIHGARDIPQIFAKPEEN